MRNIVLTGAAMATATATGLTVGQATAPPAQLPWWAQYLISLVGAPLVAVLIEWIRRKLNDGS